MTRPGQRATALATASRSSPEAPATMTRADG